MNRKKYNSHNLALLLYCGKKMLCKN